MLTNLTRCLRQGQSPAEPDLTASGSACVRTSEDAADQTASLDAGRHTAPQAGAGPPALDDDGYDSELDGARGDVAQHSTPHVSVSGFADVTVPKSATAGLTGGLHRMHNVQCAQLLQDDAPQCETQRRMGRLALFHAADTAAGAERRHGLV